MQNWPQVQQQLTIASSTLPSGGTCSNLAITGTASGNLTIPAGSECLLLAGATVTGNVTNAGTLIDAGATIKGNLTSSGTLTIQTGASVGGNLVSSAGAVTITGPATTISGNLQITGGGPFTLTGNPAAGTSYGITISGNLQVEGLASSTTVNPVCAANIGGNLLWEDNAEAATIGSATCAGNSVAGNLLVESNTLPSGDTTPAATIENNTIKGNLQTQSNTPKAVASGNTVSGTTQLN